MKESFQRLWALQQLDIEQKTLSDKLEQVPKRIRDLKKATDDLKSELEAARTDIVDHRKRYKLAEVDLKTAEEKVGSYSVQLYSAKTNEQYKAFLKEIEAQKKQKSEVEDRMIVLMEETEVLERKVRQNEVRSAELESDTARKVLALEAELKELETAIADRRDQRDRLAQALPADLLKRYERVRANKGGMAVASARKDRCSGCLSPIPAQRVLEVERQDRLYTCEACGRILIVSQD